MKNKDDENVTNIGIFTLCRIIEGQTDGSCDLMLKNNDFLRHILDLASDRSNQNNVPICKISLYLLSITLLKSPTDLKNIFGNIGGVDNMIEIIREQLKLKSWDERGMGAWQILWTATDQNPTNCMRLLVGGGIQLFLQCRKEFSDSNIFLKNMLGTFANISEIPEVRPIIMNKDFIENVIVLLGLEVKEIDISFSAAHILNNIASSTKNSWTMVEPNRRDVLNAIQKVFDNWDETSSLNISYHCLKPLFDILKDDDISDCHHLPLWTLSRLIHGDPDKYCSLLQSENRTNLIDSYIGTYN